MELLICLSFGYSSCRFCASPLEQLFVSNYLSSSKWFISPLRVYSHVNLNYSLTKKKAGENPKNVHQIRLRFRKNEASDPITKLIIIILTYSSNSCSHPKYAESLGPAEFQENWGQQFWSSMMFDCCW